ncbi:MAG: caspase family protein [Saprospiraceae bacterium]|nr:caspase family protein [Saprospiraceae bacterium]
MSISFAHRPAKGWCLNEIQWQHNVGEVQNLADVSGKPKQSTHAQPLALLVGINDYQQNGKTTVPNLTGCVNDINIFEAYLKKRFPEANRKIVKLLEGDATYENVVKNFGPAHLAQAGAGDIVVFAYSGHGSRELAAPEFAQYFPEGMMETLVLADSRWPDKYDLADKELAVLIDRVAQKGAHVAVVLDCCHSGSGTRNLDDFSLGRTRQASDRTQPRQLADYLGGHFAQHPKDFHLPASRHVLLAACDKKEKAHETRNSRGLFSTILMGVLNETHYQQGISYTQLFTEIRLKAAKNTSDQHPQIETYGYFNGLQGFLGMGSPAPDVPVKVFFQDGRWNVTMGAMSGLPTTKAQPATFEILKNGAVVGVAKTVTVGVDESSLHLEFEANENEQYDARLTSTPEPPLFFQLKAKKADAAAAMKALAVFKPLYFSLQRDFANAAYSLEIGENELRIIRNADQLYLRTLQGNDWEPMFKDAFEKVGNDSPMGEDHPIGQPRNEASGERRKLWPAT